MSPSSTVHGGQHDTKYVTFELLSYAAFVADEISGFMLEPACRGNFAVVGRQQSLFPGALIGPKLLFFFALIACNFEIFAARCLLQQSSRRHAARAAAHESSDTVRSRKAQCQALPDNPETGHTDNITSRGRSCAGEKIENRAPKRIPGTQAQQQQRHSHYYTRRHHDDHPHVRQQGT